jgi:hypothetical protein
MLTLPALMVLKLLSVAPTSAVRVALSWAV